jgi:hypothetical protein
MDDIKCKLLGIELTQPINSDKDRDEPEGEISTVFNIKLIRDDKDNVVEIKCRVRLYGREKMLWFDITVQYLFANTPTDFFIPRTSDNTCNIVAPLMKSVHDYIQGISTLAGNKSIYKGMCFPYKQLPEVRENVKKILSNSMN